MEAYITHPPLLSDADPLTRLLAAILAFLRALLAAHQATPLPAPIAPRTRAQKTRKIRAISRPRRRARQTATQHPALPRTRAVMPPCAKRPCVMTAGIPRPRLVAPH